MNKNIKALSLVLLLSSAAFVTVVVHAEPLKPAAAVTHKAAEAGAKHAPLNVGVVSATEIMVETQEGKDASKSIDAKRQKYMMLAQAGAEEIAKEQKELDAKASTMSAESQRKQATKIANLKTDLDNNQKKWMQDLQLDAQAEMEKLGKNFDTAIQKIAKETKVDLVFEKESGRIVFAADHLSLTDSVKVAMNADYKATQVASAKKDASASKTA
jgi:Skp family chaperone for outer membrane proteins